MNIINCITNWLNVNWFELCSVLALVTIPVYVTNKQINNQNRKNYQPRLQISNISVKHENHMDTERCLWILNECQQIGDLKFHDNTFNIHIKTHKNKKSKKGTNTNLTYVDYEFLKLIADIKNIGIGVAVDLRFYNLITGDICLENSSIVESNKEISTLEIPVSQVSTINFATVIKSVNQEDDKNVIRDINILLCIYRDINGNQYKFLVVIKFINDESILQSSGQVTHTKPNYTWYYVQDNTEKYTEIVKKNINQYKTILKSEKIQYFSQNLLPK